MFYLAGALVLVVLFGHLGHEINRTLVCLTGLILFLGTMRLGSR